MSDEFYMPGLSHFENDNGWSGSRGLLCYEMPRHSSPSPRRGWPL